MFKKILYIAGWSLLGVLVVVTLAFSVKQTRDVVCSEIVINYDGKQPVRLSEQEIINLAKSSGKKIIGKMLSEIDTEAIEAAVNKSKAIKKADVYRLVVRDSTSFKGVIVVKVKHKVPEARIFSSNGTYFIDKYGSQIPVSINYAVNVPVVTGNVSDEMAKEELLPFIEFLKNEKFWRAQIKQIHVNENDELILCPLVGNQLIEFGKAENYKIKLRNLKAFYEQVLANNNWDKYDRIILKYNNQVIAKKRN